MSLSQRFFQFLLARIQQGQFLRAWVACHHFLLPGNDQFCQSIGSFGSKGRVTAIDKNLNDLGIRDDLDGNIRQDIHTQFFLQFALQLIAGGDLSIGVHQAAGKCGLVVGVAQGAAHWGDDLKPGLSLIIHILTCKDGKANGSKNHENNDLPASGQNGEVSFQFHGLAFPGNFA